MVHSFLMIGQSNMAGRGRLADIPPIENKGLFMLRNGKWWPLSEPVNYDRPFAGTSLAVSFADEYQRKFGGEVGLIPCADGGSSLDDWAVKGQLYTHTVYQVRLAQKVSEIRGILWHQGEADSVDEGKARSYAPRFTRILDTLRAECKLEQIPVVLGELGEFLGENPAKKEPYYQLVNEALAELAGKSGIALASSRGFGSNGDYLHFDAKSLREFGRRYFQKYLELIHAG